jgi:ADP-dependent NAD(P)H-hydrate dehydratase / NAD(P)H-hydrate epimerase
MLLAARRSRRPVGGDILAIMKIVSAAEMRAIDRATSEKFGVPSLVLMENAGSAVARFVLGDYPKAERIGVVCGKGNNGGDGFVAARKLEEAGRAVRLLLLCDPSELRGDAATMFGRMVERASQRTENPRPNGPWTGHPLVVRSIGELNSTAAAEIFASDLIVDAVLGTGFRPPVSELYAAALRKMNESAAPIVAVDIPSGADADAMSAPDADRGTRATRDQETQAQQGIVARADAVVTFTAPRPAHVFAELTVGPTLIAPIGSPEEAISSELRLDLSTPADFATLLAPRKVEANKGSYGHVLVIGGSVGKAGAAAMAGISALRAGAGLSTVATAESALPTVAGFHPELMTEALAETGDGTISLRALESGLHELLERKTVVAIGPGISRNRETSEFVRSLVRSLVRDERKSGVRDARESDAVADNVAIVADADALNAFSGAAVQELNGRGRTFVITPHPGEMARLTGLSIAEIQAKRLEIARQFAREHELIVVLKGHRTLIAAPDGAVWVNSTGNPGMATGGTGDVLTGIVAGLIAQHPRQALLATVLAVYLHGLAGDLARDAVGESSLVATDLVRSLPEAFAAARARSDEFRMHA